MWDFKRILDVPDWGLHVDLDLKHVIGLRFTHNLNFGPLSNCESANDIHVFLVLNLRLWRLLEVYDPDLVSCSWLFPCFWYINSSKFWLSILIFKVQRTYMSFRSWFGALVGAGCSWLGFRIMVLTWIWSLVFATPIFWILALYLDFDVSKNIHVL